MDYQKYIYWQDSDMTSRLLRADTRLRCFKQIAYLNGAINFLVDDLVCSHSLVRLSASMPRGLHGSFVYRLDAIGRMSSPSSAPAPFLCRASAMGQKFDRLVFWV